MNALRKQEDDNGKQNMETQKQTLWRCRIYPVSSVPGRNKSPDMCGS